MCDWCTGKRYDQSGKCKTLCCGYTGQKLSVGGTDTTELFLMNFLMEAYGEMWQAAESGERITDDAMIVERFTGHKVKLVQGKYENIKVTTPEDLLIAEVFLKKAKKMKNCY